MRRMLAVVAMVGLLASVAAAPATATTTKIPYTCQEHLLAIIDGGVSWVTDDLVLHVRGWRATYRYVGDPLCAGRSFPIVDFDLSLVTSEGELWGTNHTVLDAYDGGYDFTWHARFITVDPLRPDATDIWTGRYVGHGYGAMDGWQVRGWILEKTHQLVEEHGYAFLPSDR